MQASAKIPGAAPGAEISGVGIGLRSPHVEQILAGRRGIRWLEILADNYLAQGGRCRRDLERLRENHPCTFHCVGMSIGSSDALNLEYLDAVKALADRYQPVWVSDHLCFVSARGEYQHDLLPLPYTEEAVRHVAGRIAQIQDRLQRRIMIENVSCYLDFQHSTMSEAEFINAVCEQADCCLLLDINNLYVNQVNLGSSARDFLDAVDTSRVRQIHLAGFEQKEGFVIDAHNHPVAANVWELYESFIGANPRIPTLIEWDFDIPDLDRLLEEARKAEARYPQRAPDASRGESPGATAARKASPRVSPGANPKVNMEAGAEASPGANPKATPRALDAGATDGAPARRDDSQPPVHALQDRFLQALKRDDAALQPHIRPLPHLALPTQLSIYRNNADNARLQALEQCYPVCIQILGERYFRQLAKAFIRAHPSRHPDLNRYGAEMPSFVKELARTREELRDYAYLPDLARLEYLHHRCYYRQDDSRTDYALLRETQGEAGRQPRLSLNHTVALLSSDFPVYEIWQAHQRADPPAEFERPPGPQRICIYREKTTPRVAKITDGDYLILQGAARTPTLGALIGALAGDAHFADRPIDRAIPELVAKNWLLVAP